MRRARLVCLGGFVALMSGAVALQAQQATPAPVPATAGFASTPTAAQAAPVDPRVARI
nr:hypothetical protein [Acidobacteriota bacterium]